MSFHKVIFNYINQINQINQSNYSNHNIITLNPWIGILNVVKSLTPNLSHYHHFIHTYLLYFNTPDEYNVYNLINKINNKEMYLLTIKGGLSDLVVQALPLNDCGKKSLKLHYFMVSENCRGTGIGKFTLNTLISHLKYFTNFDSIILECNEKLVPFYKKFGAIPIDKIRGYYIMEINF